MTTRVKSTKTDNFRFRIRPETREKLADLADSEGRSMSNWLEAVIDDRHRKLTARRKREKQK